MGSDASESAASEGEGEGEEAEAEAMITSENEREDHVRRGAGASGSGDRLSRMDEDVDPGSGVEHEGGLPYDRDSEIGHALGHPENEGHEFAGLGHGAHAGPVEYGERDVLEDGDEDEDVFQDVEDGEGHAIEHDGVGNYTRRDEDEQDEDGREEDEVNAHVGSV